MPTPSKKNISVCTCEDVWALFPGVDETSLAEYLQRHQFAALKGNGLLCVNCGNENTFTWGLAHGAGYCNKCRWPGRYYHYVKPREETYGGYHLILWYHPTVVTRTGSKEASNGKLD